MNWQNTVTVDLTELQALDIWRRAMVSSVCIDVASKDGLRDTSGLSGR